MEGLPLFKFHISFLYFVVLCSSPRLSSQGILFIKSHHQNILCGYFFHFLSLNLEVGVSLINRSLWILDIVIYILFLPDSFFIINQHTFFWQALIFTFLQCIKLVLTTSNHFKTLNVSFFTFFFFRVKIIWVTIFQFLIGGKFNKRLSLCKMKY